MNSGVINVYKDKGYTSFHVVAVLRYFTGEKKIGHTGTLDPDASGVLPVCIGKATKLVGQLTDTDKRYRAVMQLGKRTDTQDISGKVLEEMQPDDVRSIFSTAKLNEAFERLTGDVSQIPPMYSAVKVDGVKLVDAARKGKTIERSLRSVKVYGYSDISVDIDLLEVGFTIDCSKGTYVRTLCEDIGNIIKIPSCLKELERTRAAGLDISDSVTLAQIEEYASNGTLNEHMIPTDRFLLSHNYVVIKDSAIKKIIYGNYLYEDDIDDYPFSSDHPGTQGIPSSEGVFRIYDNSGVFYALYRFDRKDMCYKCEKMFI